jgi:hypothetical protein
VHRAFGNRKLRRLLGARRRKFHNEKIHNLYSPPHIVGPLSKGKCNVMGHVVSMGDIKNANEILFGKPEDI